jgi:hypothetical protein
LLNDFDLKKINIFKNLFSEEVKKYNDPGDCHRAFAA